MGDDETLRPSFSAGMRWGKRFNVGFGTCLVFAILVMVNYLSSRYFLRKEIGLSTQNALSPQTEKLLKALTNDVEITILFDTKAEEDIYGLTSKLLKEYSYRTPKILLKTIDFNRNPSAAQLLLAKHKLSGLQKNVIVFHCNDTTKVVYGNNLSEYDIQPLLNQTSKEIRRQGFKGESLFTSAILAVAYPQKLKAYFTVGHGEHDPMLTTSDRRAYSKFAAILTEENNIQFSRLYLPDTNAVPEDCNVLIVAGPSTAAFAEQELTKISNYLKSGGRALFLFNTETKLESGIEAKILAKWGVGIRFNLV
ncbi:MAG: ABC-type uncharacterized transport system involved in gliding motility auxiliary subunit, partial [Verrucomicrobiales bacterium]|nr:ABC-type uncharacterized transport system involved in gliding motility auxiliary subunit [Verrucomicrobiales bacterium]